MQLERTQIFDARWWVSVYRLRLRVVLDGTLSTLEVPTEQTMFYPRDGTYTNVYDDQDELMSRCLLCTVVEENQGDFDRPEGRH